MITPSLAYPVVFENFKPYRQKLVTTETSNEVYEILDFISEKFAQYSF